MQLIGVISDTHGMLSLDAYEALAGCEHIIHAGDICGPEILRALQTLAPVTAVLGNNDFAEYGPDVKRHAKLVIDDVRFLVAHYSSDFSTSPFGGSALAAGDPIPDVFIHGHTHLPRLDYGKKARPAQFIVNPGSTSRPRGRYPASIAKIKVHEGSVLGIRIESLSGDIIESVGVVW